AIGQRDDGVAGGEAAERQRLGLPARLEHDEALGPEPYLQRLAVGRDAAAEDDDRIATGRRRQRLLAPSFRAADPPAVADRGAAPRRGAEDPPGERLVGPDAADELELVRAAEVAARGAEDVAVALEDEQVAARGVVGEGLGSEPGTAPLLLDDELAPDHAHADA